MKTPTIEDLEARADRLVAGGFVVTDSGSMVLWCGDRPNLSYAVTLSRFPLDAATYACARRMVAAILDVLEAEEGGAE